jgi:hypothetical protein
LVVEGDDGYLKVRYGLDLQMETIAAVRELKAEKDREIVQLKADAARLKARLDQAEAEHGQLKAFLCERFADAPICRHGNELDEALEKH